MITDKDRDIYLYSLPPGSIAEMYIGFKVDPFSADELFEKAKQDRPKLDVYECNLDSGNLSVGFRRYVTIADATVG